MLQIGHTPVPGYRLERFLGRGAFGEVWQSTSPGGTRSALKFLNLAQKQGRKEFRAIQRLKQIRHANLMPINAMWMLDQDNKVIPDEYLETDANIIADSMTATMAVSILPHSVQPNVLVIAMPQAELNLLELLKQEQANGKQALDVKELLDYMRDVAKAIDFLNSPRHDLGEGLVSFQHGDIKPENMMLMGGSVLLCDFGVAKVLTNDSNVRSTSMGGSLAYISPESLDGNPSNHSDQFSLAMSYLELRTGGLPFESHSTQQVVAERMKGVIDLSGLTPAEAKVVRRALSLNPDARFDSCMDFVETLRAAVLAAPPKRSKMPIYLTLGLFIAGIIAILFAYDRSTKRDDDSEEVVVRDDLPPQGQDEYRKALELITSRNLSSENYTEATAFYQKALSSGFAATLPEPRISSLSSTYQGQARTELGSVFAQAVTHQKIAWVDGDATIVRVAEQSKLDSAVSLELPNRVMHVCWLTDDKLAVSVMSSEYGSQEVYIAEGTSLRQIAQEVTSMACVDGKCYATNMSEQLVVLSDNSVESIAEIPADAFLYQNAKNDSAVAFVRNNETTVHPIVARLGPLKPIDKIRDIELATVIATKEQEALLVLTTDSDDRLFEGIYRWDGTQWTNEPISTPTDEISLTLSRARSVDLQKSDSEKIEIIVGHIDGSVTVWSQDDGTWQFSEHYTTIGQEPVTAVTAVRTSLERSLILCGLQDGSIHCIERDSDRRSKLNGTAVPIAIFNQSLETSDQVTSNGLVDEPIDIQFFDGSLAVSYRDGMLGIWNLNHILMVLDASQSADLSLPAAPQLNRRQLSNF